MASQSTPQPTLPSPDEFVTSWCGKKEAGSVAPIRDALMAYQQKTGDGVAEFYIIWKECQNWLNPKKDGVRKERPTKGTHELKKHAGVYRLMTEVETVLHTLLGGKLSKYETKKKDGPQNVPLTKLSPGYELERSTYLAKEKKQSPFSATSIAGRGNTKLDQLSAEEFERLGQQTKVRMYFCNKAVRLRHLCSFDTSLEGWVDSTGIYAWTALTHPNKGLAHPFMCQMWAMDRYGNLFVAYDKDQYETVQTQTGSTPQEAKKALEAERGKRTMTNHSSFCAGRDVICAGMIFFWKGQLIHIDNNSGHYKPTRDSLRHAVKFLVDEYYSQCPLYLRVWDFAKDELFTAESLLALRAPDWPSQNINGNHTDIYKSIETFQY
jgi:hypothetical protein